VSQAVRPEKIRTDRIDRPNWNAVLWTNRLTRLAMTRPMRPITRKEPKADRSRFVV
jgi:hypothetical protein